MSNSDHNNVDFLQCPDEERLRLLAVGLSDPPESHELLSHAAACDCCGPRLREAVEDLAVPPSQEELRFAASTRLAHPRHRRAFARRLAGWIRQPVALWLAPAGALASLLAIYGPA